MQFYRLKTHKQFYLYQLKTSAGYPKVSNNIYPVFVADFESSEKLDVKNSKIWQNKFPNLSKDAAFISILLGFFLNLKFENSII